MQKFKLHLLLFALLGVVAAWTNRPAKVALNKATYHTYAFSNYNINGTKIYYCMDLTANGYQIGIDYDCEPPITVCTFIGDISRAHSDLTGTWFYVSDIPQSGISNTGSFTNWDY